MVSKQNLNVLIIKYDMHKIHFKCSGKIKDKISDPYHCQQIKESKAYVCHTSLPLQKRFYNINSLVRFLKCVCKWTLIYIFFKNILYSSFWHSYSSINVALFYYFPWPCTVIMNTLFTYLNFQGQIFCPYKWIKYCEHHLVFL